MIDHIGLGVSDLEASKAFYRRALEPLGYQLLMERDGSAGLRPRRQAGLLDPRRTGP